MGASWWQHFVPYQSDIASALEQLQWQVYRDGGYYWESHGADNRTEDEYIASIGGLDDDPQGMKEFMLEE